MTDAQQRLADVRAAIRDILEKGQTIQKDGRKLERADLNALRQLESQYVREAGSDTLNQRGYRSRLIMSRI